MSDDVRPQKRPKGRSPAYPAIPLDKAVQRVAQLYRAERQYPVHAQALPNVWGYSSLNGPASLTLSALLKFGLLEDEGAKDERTARVTDLAVQILDHPSSDARKEAIKSAALLPPIHREMWDEYGAKLPSDANLLWRLTRNRGFTETGAKEFVREWRETMAFAELGDDDEEVTPANEPVPSEDVVDDMASPLISGESAEALPDGDVYRSVARGRDYVVSSPSMQRAVSEVGFAAIQEYPIPIALSGRPPVVVSGAFPLSTAEWDRFKAVLEAMRPVLVGEPEPTPAADDS